MDFNIVTFHTALNQGAVLQTLALQEFIAEQGYSVGVFDYRPPIVNTMPGIRGRAFRMLRHFNAQDYVQREERFKEFVSSNLKLNMEMRSRIYLSGSDQVWNPTGSMNPMYFLQFVGDHSLRASYAASMGASKVPEMKRELFGQYISRFDAVSVREKEVKECVKDFYKGQITVNIDPTLLMNADFWKSYMRKVPNIPERYILVYILHLPKNANKLIAWLQKETNAKVVLIDGQGALTHLVHNDIALHNVGPREFLWLIHHAQSVVTSSFHGTAFSLIFQKEFYSIVNPQAPSRINHILGLVGLEPVKETDQTFRRNTSIAWERIAKVLQGEREKSAGYIRSVYELSCSKYRKPLTGTVASVRDRCTGCTACEAACPTGAIRMKLNKEGFFQPEIDPNTCIRCAKCIKICPVDKKIGVPKRKSYYGWHSDPNVRFHSSSGGAFRALADGVMESGGVVYGAVYSEDWRSVIFSDSDQTDMERIQKSKYTVSNPSGIYRKIKAQLESGRQVMFCGTPCQSAGLTRYLGKTYPNLLRCDFVCGGMASLAFYREHLDALEKTHHSKIESVDFRPKDKGWGKQRLSVSFANGKRYLVRSHLDVYFKCFANEHISVRSTCLACEYHAYHASDITLADFWGHKTAGIDKNEDGLSLLVANTDKGALAVEHAKNLVCKELDSRYSDYAFRSKSPNAAKLRQRSAFFEEALNTGFEKAANSQYKVSEWGHVKAFIKAKLHV